MFFLASLGLAQAPGDKQPFHNSAPVGNVQLRRAPVRPIESISNQYQFHITPPAEANLLIPTALKLNLPEPFTVANFEVFPPKKGNDISFLHP